MKSQKTKTNVFHITVAVAVIVMSGCDGQRAQSSVHGSATEPSSAFTSCSRGVVEVGAGYVLLNVVAFGADIFGCSGACSLAAQTFTASTATGAVVLGCGSSVAHDLLTGPATSTGSVQPSGQTQNLSISPAHTEDLKNLSNGIDEQYSAGTAGKLWVNSPTRI